MLARQEITHYTYWYDHPFLGWAMIAGYAGITDGFSRVPSGVMVGREFMLLVLIVTCALLFLLCRRLRMSRVATAATVAIFGLSPLAVFFHRMVFLDNIAVMWVIGALAVAASRRRSIAAAFWSGILMGAATLTKETIALLLPAVVWMLVQHSDKRTRPWNLSVFATTLVAVVASFPIYALLKNELLSGPGHVSLESALWWQLFGRSGSGSLLDPASGTFHLASGWIAIDGWLLLGGLALIVPGFVVRRFRPIALALLLGVAMMLRGGYLPFAYVIALLPFAALLIGGIADQLIRHVDFEGAQIPNARALRYSRYGAVAAAALTFAVLAVPQWYSDLRSQATHDGAANSIAATQWVRTHVPKDAVIVTDDYIWLDLTRSGFDRTVWLWKVDQDPAVMRDLLPDGAHSIEYIVLADQAQSTLATLPTLAQGIRELSVVAVFGEVTVRQR
jgi:Dolichyl-phosphate-mannose-protein mannosyltransferase